MTKGRGRCLMGAGLVVATVTVSCASDKGRQGEERTETARSGVTTTLETFVNKSLEIDQLDQIVGSLNPADANLHAGDDLADGTASVQFPTGGPTTWMDWDDLGGDLANHRILDLDVSGKDPTSFPQSNECVGSSTVLAKMDLTYVAASSNSKYAYFAVQRSDNNGDAGYYWLFTKLEPHLDAGGGPCKSTQKRLTYDISVGDVLLAGHFHPNGSPLLTLYKANKATTGVTAVNAVDFTNAMWTLNDKAVTAVAINSTNTAPGPFGAAGVGALSGGNLAPEIFAEAAVDMAAFTGGASSCGAQFYGSVITRSSGAGGTSPDLKDLAGPAKFNFGSLTLSATLTGGCDLKLGFDAGAKLPDGTSLPNAACKWTITNGTDTYSPTTCSSGQSPITVPAGSYTATVTVDDGTTGCSGTATASGVVYAPIDVNLTPKAAAPTCPSMSSDAVAYDANASGGKGPYTYTWSGATCSGASCSIDPSDATFCTSVDLQVTVSDSSGVCTAKTSEKETYTKVTTITATNN